MAASTFGGLDSNTLTGTSDFFLTKYSPSGTKVYTRQLGATGVDTYGEAVETDEDGNVVVSGVTSGGLDGNNCVGSWNSFVTRYGNQVEHQTIECTGLLTFTTVVAYR